MGTHFKEYGNAFKGSRKRIQCRQVMHSSNTGTKFRDIGTNFRNTGKRLSKEASSSARRSKFSGCFLGVPFPIRCTDRCVVCHSLQQALRAGGLLVIVDDMNPCLHGAIEPTSISHSLMNGTNCANFDRKRDLNLFEKNWHGNVLDPLVLERDLQPFTLLRAENLVLSYPMPHRNRLLLRSLLCMLSWVVALLPDSKIRLVVNAHLGGFAREQAYVDGKLLYAMLVAQAS